MSSDFENPNGDKNYQLSVPFAQLLVAKLYPLLARCVLNAHVTSTSQLSIEAQSFCAVAASKKHYFVIQQAAGLSLACSSKMGTLSAQHYIPGKLADSGEMQRCLIALKMEVSVTLSVMPGSESKAYLTVIQHAVVADDHDYCDCLQHE